MIFWTSIRATFPQGGELDQSIYLCRGTVIDNTSVSRAGDMNLNSGPQEFILVKIIITTTDG
jgi:hypothetical protein